MDVRCTRHETGLPVQRSDLDAGQLQRQRDDRWRLRVRNPFEHGDADRDDGDRCDRAVLRGQQIPELARDVQQRDGAGGRREERDLSYASLGDGGIFRRDLCGDVNARQHDEEERADRGRAGHRISHIVRRLYAVGGRRLDGQRGRPEEHAWHLQYDEHIRRLVEERQGDGQHHHAGRCAGKLRWEHVHECKPVRRLQRQDRGDGGGSYSGQHAAGDGEGQRRLDDQQLREDEVRPRQRDCIRRYDAVCVLGECKTDLRLEQHCRHWPLRLGHGAQCRRNKRPKADTLRGSCPHPQQLRSPPDRECG